MQEEKTEITPEEFKTLDMNEVSYIQMTDGTVIVIYDEENNKNNQNTEFQEETVQKENLYNKVSQTQPQVLRSRHIVKPGAPALMVAPPNPFKVICPVMACRPMPGVQPTSVLATAKKKKHKIPVTSEQPRIFGAYINQEPKKLISSAQPQLRTKSVGRSPQSNTFQPTVLRARPTMPFERAPMRPTMPFKYLNANTFQPRSVGPSERYMGRRTVQPAMPRVFRAKPGQNKNEMLDECPICRQERAMRSLENNNEGDIRKSVCVNCGEEFIE